MERAIITIDENKCNGCGLCIPNCPEGAMQVINGKARLISDLFCDGLGACLGHCPQGAITIEHREAEPYDEKRVMANVVKGGPDVIKAHLRHLRDHGQEEYLTQAVEYIKENDIEMVSATLPKDEPHGSHCGCPGSKAMDLRKERHEEESCCGGGKQQSELNQWPVQLQLLNPHAPYFKDAELVISADCVPFAYPDFHRRFLKGKILVIFCPKLDTTLDQYVEKLATVFKENNIKSVTLVHMEVPCCFGVERIVTAAMEKAGKNVMMKDYTISISGEII